MEMSLDVKLMASLVDKDIEGAYTHTHTVLRK